MAGSFAACHVAILARTPEIFFQAATHILQAKAKEAEEKRAAEKQAEEQPKKKKAPIVTTFEGGSYLNQTELPSVEDFKERTGLRIHPRNQHFDGFAA